MKKLFTLLLLLNALLARAQEDLLAELEKETPKKKDFVSATFKGTRLINLHTVEVPGKRVLDFRIAHRFGDVGSGLQNFYGLDGPAYIKLSFDYSWNGRLAFGIGRNSSQKLYEGLVKYKILRQTTDNKMPVTVTWVSGMNVNSSRSPYAGNPAFTSDPFDDFWNRVSYIHQLMIGRKFGSRASLQVSPTWVHYNLVDRSSDANDMFGLGFVGRIKVSKRIAITSEYMLRLNRYSNNFGNYYNSLGIGIDVETGGHVFQMHFVNSSSLNEAQLLPYTTQSWLKGGFRLGFNISRAFAI